MSEEQMNSYRLTSMEEPGDERMAQIMREVAEDARGSTRRAAERVAAGIEAASHEIWCSGLIIEATPTYFTNFIFFEKVVFLHNIS